MFDLVIHLFLLEQRTTGGNQKSSVEGTSWVGGLCVGEQDRVPAERGLDVFANNFRCTPRHGTHYLPYVSRRETTRSRET